MGYGRSVGGSHHFVVTCDCSIALYVINRSSVPVKREVKLVSISVCEYPIRYHQTQTQSSSEKFDLKARGKYIPSAIRYNVAYGAWYIFPTWGPDLPRCYLAYSAIPR